LATLTLQGWGGSHWHNIYSKNCKIRSYFQNFKQ